MTAAVTNNRPTNKQNVSDAIVVGEKLPFRHMHWWLIGLSTCALLMFIIISSYDIWRDNLIAQGVAQGEAKAKAALTTRQAEVKRLNEDATRLRQSLSVEVAEKKRLAVLYERVEAARKQAVADHAVLAARLRGYETTKEKLRKK